MLRVLKVPCKAAPYTECKLQPSTIQQRKNQKEGSNTTHEATEGNNTVTEHEMKDLLSEREIKVCYSLKVYIPNPIVHALKP